MLIPVTSILIFFPTANRNVFSLVSFIFAASETFVTITILWDNSKIRFWTVEL